MAIMSDTMCKALAVHVAQLLADARSTHPNFMVWLEDELQRRDYRIEAHQRGIAGTYLCIVKDEG